MNTSVLQKPTIRPATADQMHQSVFDLIMKKELRERGYDTGHSIAPRPPGVRTDSENRTDAKKNRKETTP
jgi:hypothetical protein